MALDPKNPKPQKIRKAVARKSTAIDMTPMVDLAFLLITFFMLTVKFRPPEAVQVTIPSSIADTPVPAKDIMLISVAGDGRIFFSVDSKFVREGMIEKLNERRKLGLSKEEMAIFSREGEFGVPFKDLKRWLSTPDFKRPEFKQTGIPMDSTDNELREWLIAARITNPGQRLAVKADENTEYPVVRRVIETLQDQDINRFNLVTKQEALPAGFTR
jgi:biopolymer transport protein ExbD